jgi:hypothetical protein
VIVVVSDEYILNPPKSDDEHCVTGCRVELCAVCPVTVVDVVAESVSGANLAA